MYHYHTGRHTTLVNGSSSFRLWQPLCYDALMYLYTVLYCIHTGRHTTLVNGSSS